MKSFQLALASALGLAVAASPASAQTQTPPAQTTTHSESTTKSTQAGKTTKTKVETVVGTVKEYEANKKIVVTGPKKKDYSFDLDENSGVTGDIAVGTRVSVKYTKDDSGQKVTTVKPYQARKKTKSA